MDSRSPCDSLSYNSMVFLYKAHAVALTLTVTLSLTQTDVIKRLFIRSQNPACLPATILWFLPPIAEAGGEKLYSYSCFNNKNKSTIILLYHGNDLILCPV